MEIGRKPSHRWACTEWWPEQRIRASAVLLPPHQYCKQANPCTALTGRHGSTSTARENQSHGRQALRVVAAQLALSFPFLPLPLRLSPSRRGARPPATVSTVLVRPRPATLSISGTPAFLPSFPHVNQLLPNRWPDGQRDSSSAFFQPAGGPHVPSTCINNDWAGGFTPS